MANDNLRLSLEIAASGAGATVRELLSVRRAIEQTAATSGGIAQLARVMGTNYEAARRFAEGLRLAPDAAALAIGRLRELNGVGASSEVRFGTLTAQLGVTVRQFQALDRAAREGGSGLGAQAAQLAQLAFGYNNVSAAIQSLAASAKPAYDLLIASNEQLNAQILSSQTNLASSTRLFSGGEELTDPTAKINATRDAIKAALKQVEVDTQQLVGVTSSEVNELFQITLTNAAALNNQSKAFPDAISAATSLTKGWAASLKVIGVPLFQARQEINSILKGQVDQNSILAKNLNITNDQVRQWQAQGRLVDELNVRLNTFVAGNAIAARSIDGIGSNIKDLVERLGRVAGEPLLEPIIQALAAVEKYLKENEQAITTFFAQFVDEVLRAGGAVGEAFAPLGKTLLEIGERIGPIALGALKGLLAVFVGLSQVLAPVANLLALSVKVLTDLAGTDLGGIAIQTAVVTIALTQLGTIAIAFATTTLPVLWASLVTTTTTMGTLYAAIVAMTTGNFALAASIPFLVTGFNILTAAALPLAAALIPLTGAIALTGLVRATNDLVDANDALEAYGKQVLSAADAVGSISVKLNALNKIREDGGILSEEQLRQEKQLRIAAKAQAESIEATIKQQRELTKLSADQTIQRDNQIKQLEALQKKLDLVTGGLSIEAKELENLGNSYEQLAKRADSANRNIRTGGGGDPEVFKKSISELTKTIEQQVKLRQINLADAAASLEQVRSDVRVEVDVQQAAKDSIVKIYNERVGAIKELLANGVTDQRQSLEELAEIRDRAEVREDPRATAEIRKRAGTEIVAILKQQNAAELAEIEAARGKVEALQSAQRLSEAEGDRQLTEIKRQELLKRLELNRVLLDSSATLTDQTETQRLVAEQERLFAEREKIEGEFEKRSRDRAVAAFDVRRKQVQALYDLGIVDQQTYNRTKLENDLEQQDLALKQQERALGLLDAADAEGRAAGLGRIAEINSKKEGLIREGIEAEKRRLLTDYDERLVELDRFYAEGLASDGAFLEAKKELQLGRADDEITILTQQLERLGAADEDGREAINATISKLQVGKIKILEEGYAAELALLRDAQAKALDLVRRSEEQRAIELQRLVNNRSIRQEDADKERNRQNVSRQRAELQQVTEFEASLARTAGAVRSAEGERNYQQQVREARGRTLAVTLQLLQTEGSELQRVRGLALKGIEDEVAARTRATDLQLSKIAEVRSRRLRSVNEAEAGVAREVAAIDVATKALERQNGLLLARNGLQKAVADERVSGGNLELERITQVLAIRRQLEAGIIPYAEYQVQIQRLAELGVDSSVSDLVLNRRKLEIGRELSEERREALNLEQGAARAALALEQQKIDLANQRAVIEARIAELKAKQGVLDARQLVNQTELNNRRSIEAAKLAIDQANGQAPGRDRDRAIAEAKAKFEVAKSEAETNVANALQGVDLAREQVDLAKQNTIQVLEQVKSQVELKRLQVETLDVQQRTVLAQFKAAEAAKAYANELERAKAAVEGTSFGARTVSDGRGVQTLPGRAGGGSVRAGQAYIVGERSPEVFVPGVSGTVLNREQVLKNLSGLTAGSFAAPVASGSLTSAPLSERGGDSRETIAAIRSLEQTILSRPPAPIVANFAAADDGQLDRLFALQRSSLRIS